MMYYIRKLKKIGQADAPGAARPYDFRDDSRA